MNLVRSILLLIFMVSALPAGAAPLVLRHDLEVELLPQEQALEGKDRLTIATEGTSHLFLALSPGAKVRRVSVEGKRVPWDFHRGELSFEIPPRSGGQRITVQIEYRASFSDTAPETPLSAEDPSFGVTGTISPRGTFLGGGSGWYPELYGSLPTFRLRVKAPPETIPVTSGRLVSMQPGETVWEIEKPVRSLALAAGPYRKFEDRAGEVPVYAFFYPGTQELARIYLEAAQGYMNLYQDLFGDYPFPKFAVAENFFPTGYGYPSWTLLGSAVVRLPFIVQTSLGHEIAHSWWGNGVWVDYTRGNWSEGLTTYVADHLYKERESPEEGREYRLKILRDYASLVPPEKDFPLVEFISRTTAAEQAVGYGKSAMVFHMARQRVGEEAFWAGLRNVVRDKLFREARWFDFATALGESGKTDLKDFFRQWTERPGAPVLAFENIRKERTGSGWEISGVLRQRGKIYDLQVPVRLETDEGPIDQILEAKGESTPFSMATSSLPRSLLLDPEVHVFRRLDVAEIPATVNGIRGSTDLVAVSAKDLPRETRSSAALLLEAMGKKTRILMEQEVQAGDLRGHDILFLGVPTRKDLMPLLPAGVKLSAEGFVLEGRDYRGEQAVLFAALPHPTDAGRVAAVFIPGSPEAAATAARKIPHYGKYSFLAFVEGTNVAKGIWPVPESPAVYRFSEP